MFGFVKMVARRSFTDRSSSADVSASSLACALASLVLGRGVVLGEQPLGSFTVRLDIVCELIRSIAGVHDTDEGIGKYRIGTLNSDSGHHLCTGVIFRNRSKTSLIFGRELGF